VGEVRYWSGGKLIDGVGLTLAKTMQSASADDAVMVRNVVIDPTTVTVRAEIWYDGADAVSNLNLSFNKNGDGHFAATLNPALLGTAGWSTFVNDSATSYRVSGISLQSISAPFKIMDVEASLSAGGPGVVLAGGVVGNHTIRETSLLTSLAAVSDQGLVDVGLVSGLYSASLSKAALPEFARDVIDSRDALMALRMATGELSVNQIDSKYQFAAADVDGNGVVQVKDAWAIARFGVGLTNAAHTGEWLFFDAAADVSGLSAGRTRASSAVALEIQTGVPASANWVGVALGDIDGSLKQLYPYLIG
jgi:hypothetical protein